MKHRGIYMKAWQVVVIAGMICALSISLAGRYSSTVTPSVHATNSVQHRCLDNKRQHAVFDAAQPVALAPSFHPPVPASITQAAAEIESLPVFPISDHNLFKRPPPFSALVA